MTMQPQSPGGGPQPDHPPGFGWSVLVAAIVLGWWLLSLSWPKLWGVLGVSALPPHFQDMAAVLASSEAKAAGLDPFLPNPLDSLNRPHVYGPWWLGLASWGFTRADAWWLGAGCVISFIGVCVGLVRPADRWRAGMLLLLMMSPPVMLALERANNDLVVFLLLAGAGGALLRGGGPAVALATLAVVVAAALKFYPMVALPVLVMACPGRRGWKLFGGGLLLCGLIGVVWHEDITRAFQVVPQPRIIDTVGLRSFVDCWGFPTVVRPALMVGWLSGGAGSAYVLWRATGRGCADDSARGIPVFFALGALAWLACYVVNTNFLYRQVLLLLPAVQWFREWGSSSHGALAKTQLGLLAVASWAWMPWGWLAATTQVGEDVPVVIFWILTGVAQGCMLGLTLKMGERLWREFAGLGLFASSGPESV